jgi:L-ascorbate oxidase
MYHLYYILLLSLIQHPTTAELFRKPSPNNNNNSGDIVTGSTGSNNVENSELIDLPVFKSNHKGIVEVELIAQETQVPQFKVGKIPIIPKGWTYKVCSTTTCVDTFGGVRYDFQRGDTFNIKLTNHLPPTTGIHQYDDMHSAFLGMNPTNLHFHGFVVAPLVGKMNTNVNNTTWYSDFIYAAVFNPENGLTPTTNTRNMTFMTESMFYHIDIPKSHPVGLFWLHPHIHGLTQNQITAGMGAMMTIGSITDFVPGSGDIPVRHLLLQSSQILPNGVLQDQPDPEFCSPIPGHDDEPFRSGKCPGIGDLYDGGYEFYTINGQVYPKISIPLEKGQIWRITTSVASITFDLQIVNAIDDTDIIKMQVLFMDGASVFQNATTTSNHLRRRRHLKQHPGSKTNVVSCLGDDSNNNHNNNNPTTALCVEKLYLMPSSRVDVFIQPPVVKKHEPVSTKYILKTTGVNTGPDGDYWPEINLAEVIFVPPNHGKLTEQPKVLLVQNNQHSFKKNHHQHNSNTKYGQVITPLLPPSKEECQPLLPGYKRKITLGVPADSDGDGFGIGWEILDNHSATVPGTKHNVISAPHGYIYCIPVGAREIWIIENISLENHNFHVHINNFKLLSTFNFKNTNNNNNDEVGEIPTTLLSRDVTMDNVPVPFGATVEIETKFDLVGPRMVHCHISEHSDGGMGANIYIAG